jgi:hypothetical protein
MKNQRSKITTMETKKAKDLPEYLQLVTGSREVKTVLEHIREDPDDDYQDIDWLFVDTGQGEYLEVWGGSGAVVYKTDIARRLL